MNKLLVSLFLFGLAITTMAQIQTAMTYNLRYDSPHDGDNVWELRKSELVKLINFYSPDVLGTQEGMHHQLSYLQENLKGYRFIGVGRDDGKTKGEYSAIFYNSSKHKVLEQGTFWLSETPDRVSKGWGANFNRVCTYGLFEELSSGQKLLVFNAHFDHESIEARENSAILILHKVQEINSQNLPVVLMGDFNCIPDSQPIQSFLQSFEDPAKRVSGGIYGPLGTFSGFDINPALKERIDYILTTDIQVSAYRHVDDRRENGLWPSDHLPVIITTE